MAWQRATELAQSVYALAEMLPTDERFGLSAQMKRAAVSVVSNIAEGCGRSTDQEFEHFLSMASGSASELRSQIELVNILWPAVMARPTLDLAHEVKRLLWSLREASRKSRSR